MTTLPRAASRPRVSAVVAAAIVAIAAFALGRVLWPDPPGAAAPPSELMPYFVVLSVIESVLFGAGVGFAIIGWPRLRGRTADGRAWAAYVSICFMMLSWWPHDNLHRVLGHHDFAGLARIEYLFHVPLWSPPTVWPSTSVGGSRHELA
jgi:hypothetical protein